MSDEAKEIERLRTILQHWRRFDELESQQIYALARRLLAERDEARQSAWNATQRLAACQILAQGEEPNVDYETVSPAVEAVRKQKERIASLESQLEDANARIANEQAARQLAQEHGIGDRARIKELERELEKARKQSVNLVRLALEIFEDAKPSTPEERRELKSAMLKYLGK